MDKTLKGLQQRFINIARVVAALHTTLPDQGDIQACSQMLFWYLLQSEDAVLRERKRLSIPGSVVDNSNAMFTAEDLKNERNWLQINRAGMFFPNKHVWHFPIPKGPKYWRFKPNQGFYGRGKSGGRSFGMGWRSSWNNAKGSSWTAKGKGKSCTAKFLCTYTRCAAYCRHHFRAYGRPYSFRFWDSVSSTPHLGDRKEMGKYTFARKVAGEFKLVEKSESPTTCFGPDSIWSKFRLSIAGKNVNKNDSQESSGHLFGRKIFGGLPTFWCSPKAEPHPFSFTTFSAMVQHFQKKREIQKNTE